MELKSYSNYNIDSKAFIIDVVVQLYGKWWYVVDLGYPGHLERASRFHHAATTKVDDDP